MTKTEQRASSLATAVRVKAERMAMRERLRSPDTQVGSWRLAAALLDCRDPAIERMRLPYLLQSLRKVGATVEVRILRILGVRDRTKRVGELTDRQRQVLYDLLSTGSLFDWDRSHGTESHAHALNGEGAA